MKGHEEVVQRDDDGWRSLLVEVEEKQMHHSCDVDAEQGGVGDGQQEGGDLKQRNN